MAAKDSFSNVDLLVSQGRRATQLAALSDSVDLVEVPKALWFDVAGTIAVTPVDGVDGTSVAFTVPAGPFDMVRVKRIWATGTVTIVPANVKMIF